MPGTIEDMQTKIRMTEDLAGIIRTMKALSASKISQYDEAVRATKSYFHTVRLGLSICFAKKNIRAMPLVASENQLPMGALIIGSDLGLIGRFNELLAEFAINKLSEIPGPKKIWVVGERMYAQLKEKELPIHKIYHVPNSLKAISTLVGKLLIDLQISNYLVFRNRLTTGEHFEQVKQQLLPLDEKWIQQVILEKWITKKIPEVLSNEEQTVKSLIREYLFSALFQACVDSMAAENMTRLSAMQRAEKNISDLLSNLHRSYQQERQQSIDEELFDIIGGYVALND